MKTVMDPADPRYIGWSHLESDECGALNGLAVSPKAEPVAGFIGLCG